MSAEAPAAPAPVAPTAPTPEAPAPVAPSAAAAIETHSEGAPPAEAPAPDAPPSWANGLDSDAMGFIGTKGWDKAENPVAEMLKSYRNVERLRGVNADQLVRIPDEGNAEQMAEFRARLGVPESAEGYGPLEVEAMGQTLDAAALAAVAHSIDATPDQFAKLGLAAKALIESTAEQQAQAAVARDAAQEVELMAEWGALQEENTVAAAKGFGLLGLDAEGVDALQQALGYRAVMEMGARVGRMSGEARRGDIAEPGSDQPFGMTTASAAAERTRLGADPEFRRSLTDTTHPQHAMNKARWDQLGQVAYHSG